MLILQLLASLFCSLLGLRSGSTRLCCQSFLDHGPLPNSSTLFKSIFRSLGRVSTHGYENQACCVRMMFQFSERVLKSLCVLMQCGRGWKKQEGRCKLRDCHTWAWARAWAFLSVYSLLPWCLPSHCWGPTGRLSYIKKSHFFSRPIYKPNSGKHQVCFSCGHMSSFSEAPWEDVPRQALKRAH